MPTETEFALNPLRGSVVSLEAVLEAKAIEVKAEARDMVSPSDDADETNGSKDYFEYELWRLSDVFPGQLRSSCLTSVYSIVEREFQRVAGSAGALRGLRLKPRDLSGSGMRQARAYLDKVMGVEFPEPWPAWSTMEVYRAVRNCVVHHGGVASTDEDKKRIQAALRQVRGASLGSDGSLEFDNGAVIAMIEVAETVLSGLYDSLEEQDVRFFRSPLG